MVITKNSAQMAKTKGMDVRMKLIAKKRTQIKDARERLGQIARQSDARLKLNNKNAVTKNTSKLSGRIGFNKNSQGNRIGMHKPNNPVLQMQVTNPLALKNWKPAPQANNNKGQLRVQISNRNMNNQNRINRGNVAKPMMNKTINGAIQKNTPVRVARPGSNLKQTTPKQALAKHSIAHKYYNSKNTPSSATKKTFINNKFVQNQRSATSNASRSRSVNGPQKGYKINQAVMNIPSLANIKSSANSNFKNVWFPGRSHNNQRNSNQNQFMGSNMGSGQIFNSNMGSSYSRQDRSNVMSRFERDNMRGFKLFVSNLHPIVTPEDVQELFQTIGPLKYSRMLGRGSAEVVFTNKNDAFRAVEVYHNRQLDGQPMNVLFAGSDNSGQYDGFQSGSRHYNQYGSDGHGMDSSSQYMAMNRFAGNGMFSNDQMNITPDMNTIQQALFGAQRQMSMSNSRSYNSMKNNRRY